MRVVIAPDSFKGSISAADAAAALAHGWSGARAGDEVIELPLADGGEGTLAVLAATDPAARWHQARVSGPAGDPLTASWLELAGNVAVVELAAAAGLTLLAGPRPLAAHSYGVGQLIGQALDRGARQVVVGLGGSACTDGGTGALSALGARFLAASGQELPRGGGALIRLAAVDLSGLRPAPSGGVSCLTDVRAPLLGRTGAAAVFGPQKGADEHDVKLLEAGLARLASLLGGDPAQPGAGAAGGTGYGLAAAWGARLRPGAAEIARLAGLAPALAGAGLVITGEGQFDRTSTTGKVTGAVLAAARRAGVPAAVVAGQVSARPPAEVRAVDLAGLAGGQMPAIGAAAHWLAEAGRRLAAAPPGQGAPG